MARMSTSAPPLFEQEARPSATAGYVRRRVRPGLQDRSVTSLEISAQERRTLERLAGPEHGGRGRVLRRGLHLLDALSGEDDALTTLCAALGMSEADVVTLAVRQLAETTTEGGFTER